VTGSMQDRSHVHARRRLSPLTAPAAFLAACGLLLNLVPPRAAEAQTGPRPNILVILTDDQRAEGTLGVMPKTRKLFVAGGTTFKNAVATTPLCCPSRASILSGRYAHNHGVTDNFSAGLLDQRKTMQKELQASGYLTAATGKFLNGWRKDPSYFDRWAIYSPPLRYFGATFRIDGVVREVPGYSTTFIERMSLEFLDHFEHSDSDPWFLQVSPFAPHWPALPESRYSETSVPDWVGSPATGEADVSDKPPYIRRADNSREAVERFRAGQLRTLMSVDDLVANLFAELDRLGEREDTLAFFLSDNGVLWYEHGARGKSMPYDPSVRLPLLARWPGHLGAGIRDRRIAGNIDIAATIYDALGIQPGYRVDGRSLLTSDRRFIFLEHTPGRRGGIPAWNAIWTPATTYVRYVNGRREYYGPDDPWQLTNVYNDGVTGNAPDDAGELDAFIEAGSGCAGSSCE